MAVVREEGVVPRRGSLVLSPFGGGEYCGVDDPSGLDLHQHGGATHSKLSPDQVRYLLRGQRTGNPAEAAAD
jgi:hypothetical protein